MRYRIIVLVIFLLPLSVQLNSQHLELAKPSPKQIRFADWEVGAFIHFGLNVFTGMEHGDGQFPPSYFNPSELDAEQWVLTAKAMGAKYACLTVRHEGGFCLWPSKTTEYTIANSPYKDGKGDIAREFVDACRKHGVVPAFYHTAAFDANATLKDYKGELDLPLQWMSTWGKAMSSAHKADPELRERLKKMQVEQMRELLTNYGPIGFMWSDHWDAKDENGVWRAVTDLASELQPNMVFMGTDTWVPGNETGHVVYPMWNAIYTQDNTVYSRPAAVKGDIIADNNYGLLEGEVRTGHPHGEFWRPRECTTHSAFHYGGWFWHPDSIKKTYPKKHWEHLDLYYRTVGLGANVIINLPPDNRGLIPDDIVDAAGKLGDAINERFSNPIAQLTDITKADTVELIWDHIAEINTVVTMENIENGQRVASYSLEAFVDGAWKPLDPRNKLIGFTPYNNNPGYQTIGHKKIDRIRPVLTNKLRFCCLESISGSAEIRSLAVYNCPVISPDFDSDFPMLSGIETEIESAHNGVRRDVNYIGEPIIINQKEYKSGLMVCPVAQDKKGYVVFDMKQYQNVKGLTARIGFDDLRGKGSGIFIVEGMIHNKWVELYKSKLLVSGESLGVEVIFPKDIEKLRLTVTDGGDTHWNDHAVWANAMFILNSKIL